MKSVTRSVSRKWKKWSEMSFVIIKHLAFSADAIFEIHFSYISQKIGFDIANYNVSPNDAKI